MDFAFSERPCSFLLELILFVVFLMSPPVDGFCNFRAVLASASDITGVHYLGGDHGLMDFANFIAAPPLQATCGVD